MKELRELYINSRAGMKQILKGYEVEEIILGTVDRVLEENKEF